MVNKKINEKIKNIIINKLGKNVLFNDDTPLVDIGVNSYVIIQIVVEIENAFGIEFDDDKLTYNTLESVSSIASYINTNMT